MNAAYKLSNQNQIDKDESYHRDEIAKIKSISRNWNSRRQPNQFERPTAGRIDFNKKRRVPYKDALRDKEHELERVKEELSRREEMISNINEGLRKAKDEATATYSDYVKENNRLKIAVSQVQNAYEELYKKYSQLTREHSKQLKDNKKALGAIRDLKSVVEEQQDHIHKLVHDHDEKEKAFQSKLGALQDDLKKRFWAQIKTKWIVIA